MKLSESGRREYERERELELGFVYVLDGLRIVTPFGRDRLKNLTFFTESSKDELFSELANIEMTFPLLGLFDSLCEKMSMLRDLRRSFAEIKRRALEDTELFELKCFLIIYSGIYELLKNTFLAPTDLNHILDLIDFDKKRAMTFYVSEDLSEKLREIRAEKKRLECEIFDSSSAAGHLLEKRAELAVREAEEEYEIRAGLTASLRPYVSELAEAAERLGYIDFLFAKTEYAALNGGVAPKYAAEPHLSLVNAMNPYANSLLSKSGRQLMPVSICLESGVTVITGANMGGKSLSMKTFALNQMLYQHGFYVFAESARLCLFDSIELIFDEGRLVQKGLSTFGAQIVRLNRAVGNVKKGRCLVIIDELAGGTNPNEGVRLVKAVVRYLNRFPSVTLMSTHYDEAVGEGIAHYQVTGLKNADFAALKKKLHAGRGAGSLRLISEAMDYRLIKVSGREKPPRDALNICRLLGLEPEIIEEYEETGDFADE